MRVLVIGAGLAGLCLAQGLRKAGINVEIFEKQPQDLEDTSGYGIHINTHGQRALRACLANEQWLRFIALSTPAGNHMCFRNTKLQVLWERNDPKSSVPNLVGELYERRGIGRADLRNILLDGLKENLHWGKSFTHFEQFSDGSVHVHFADGTTKNGDVLVGADGPRSGVRKQYLPQFERVDLGIQAIAGRCKMNQKFHMDLPNDLIDGSLNNVVPYGKGWMFVSSWTLPSMNDTVCAMDRSPHVVWAYVVPKEDSLNSGEPHDGSELQQFVMRSIEAWSPSIQNLVSQSEASTISCIPLRSMPHLSPWVSSNVTLIGDAIHNMTPMAGVGANTALRDAQNLSELLISVASGKIDLKNAISKYENDMRSYANEAVELSRRNAISASEGTGIRRSAFYMFLKAKQYFS